MNKNSICSFIVKNHYKKKLLTNLQDMQTSISKLNYFIELRWQQVPIGLDKNTWINNSFDELSKMLLDKNLLQQVNKFIKKKTSS